jgi:hypothetical protein
MKPIPALSAVKATDEFLVFEVQSFSDPTKVYRVDKSLWFGSGSCSCEQFCCRIQPELGKGNWVEPTTCKHINLTDRFISCQAARLAIQERQKLTKTTYNPSETNL